MTSQRKTKTFKDLKWAHISFEAKGKQRTLFDYDKKEKEY